MDTLLNLLGGEGLTATVIAAIAGVFGLVRKIETVRKNNLDKALACVETGVRETYETYVRELKKAREDGKLTPEERQAAVAQAIETAKVYAREQGIDLLKYYAKEYLPVLVDRFVSWRKLPFGSGDLPELEQGR